MCWGSVVTGAVMLIRFLWVFPATYLPHKVTPGTGFTPPWQYPLLVSWTGMRGAVSLAAALAIPLHTDAGGDFPAREIIIFCTYAVILATLLVEGLSLPWLIRWLGVEEDSSLLGAREAKARIAAAEAALARLAELKTEAWVPAPTHERMQAFYDFRLRRFSAHLDDDDDGAIERGSQVYQRLRREVLEAERAAIIRLRNAGEINDDVMRRIEHDLDLEHARLED
jgi:CPA1 family monovalent cation:H+ antiporter